MDIVERLRKRAVIWLSFGWGNNDIYDEAAYEIERLREELAETKLCSCRKRDQEIEQLFEELSQ
jgi:hypothetical protein